MARSSRSIPKGRSCLARRTRPAPADARWRIGRPGGTGRGPVPRWPPPVPGGRGLEGAPERAGEPKGRAEGVGGTGDPGGGGASPKLLFLAVDVSRELLLQRRLLQADRLAQVG